MIQGRTVNIFLSKSLNSAFEVQGTLEAVRRRLPGYSHSICPVINTVPKQTKVEVNSVVCLLMGKIHYR
jgi:hypothetical protein